MKIGHHQRSALGPLLFVIAVDILTEDGRDGSSIDFLYTDNFALCGETLDEVIGTRKRWKKVLEGKGPRTNAETTKGMQLLCDRKLTFLRWVFGVSVLNRSTITLFGPRNVRSRNVRMFLSGEVIWVITSW